MENKINIAELLKDCPMGMELDCTMFEDCTFLDVDEKANNYVIRITTPCGIKYLDKYGRYVADYKAKCVISPKGKTTWEGFVPPCKFKDGFVPPCKFKDGDIVFYLDTIAIFKEWGDETLFRTHVVKYLHCDSLIDVKVPLFGKNVRKEIRFATEEEKKKLFKAIKDNGYRWNANTKTLEKLVEPKFKVGDKVQHKGATSCGSVYEVEKMRVVDNCMEYTIKLLWYNNCSITVAEENLQPYKEETMEEQKKDYEEWFPTDYLEFENNDDTWADEVEINLGKDYEIQIRGDKTFIVKKKPQYPKTFIEVLNFWHPDRQPEDDYQRCYKKDLIEKFQDLLYARDSYWKIAGEQMGLGKPWEPDWSDESENKYTIVLHGNKNCYANCKGACSFLTFPTAEMRDAFYENFKELIEECKTFL